MGIILYYHTTHMAPRPISLGNHKKKVSYEGRTIKVIGPEKNI